MSNVWVDKQKLMDVISAESGLSRTRVKTIIEDVISSKPREHTGECKDDPFARDVCTGMYLDKIDDNQGLADALRTVLSLAGEDQKISEVIEKALDDYATN